MMASQLVTNAARDGARLAAIDGSTNQQVRDAVLEFLDRSLGPNSSTASVSIEVNGTSNEVANSTPGDMCTVTVSVPYSEITLTRAQFLDNSNIVGHCAMRREW
jgi:Flp pilus assembly protein TadG